VSDFYSKNRLACVEILDAWGIDARNVATFGVNGEGYFEFQRDAFGHKIIVNDEDQPQMRSRTWPEGFPVEEFMGHVAALNGEYYP